MAYTTLLFDFDHTLFDSDTSEREAFSAALQGCGVDAPRQHYATYQRINSALWSAVERGEIEVDALHVLRFERLIQALGLDADPAVLAKAFARGMGDHGELYPTARETLDQLASKARLALVTNGLGGIQRARLDRLGIADHFASIVISTEVGASKPGKRIFDVAFAQLGQPRKASALMVGDSLASDIRGGQRYGIATCWYNPHGASAEPSSPVTHQITALEQLPNLVTHRRV